ncbi:MAG: peroxiredoxin [Planctomycetia bacterium]|nr:peroxiredoxin [Planctomycetia bacterium]
MGILVTREAPDFKTSAVMPDLTFADLTLSQFRGKYVILFFYPLDFTFVCPTEIRAFSDSIEDFEKRNVQILGCSVDSPYCHLAWMKTSREEGGLGPIRFPLLSDITKGISAAYDVLLPDAGVALRGLFLIDRKGIVQHELVNNLPLGRSIKEALRTLEELQYIEEHGEVCPANWQPGEPGISPGK